jgi:hypothetical protein
MTRKCKKPTSQFEATAPDALPVTRQPRVEKRVRTVRAKNRAPLPKAQRILTREARVRILIAAISAVATLLTEPIRVAASQYLGQDLHTQSQCRSQERK